MKKITTLGIAIFALLITTQAQNILNQKWHLYYIGGNKGYYVKTYQFTATTMTENQFGSGGQFDNNPMEIKVAEIVADNGVEKVITDYGDSTYYVMVFKNLTADKADVCYNTNAFKTINEAKAYEPTAAEYQTWYTETGYKAADKKPAMPVLTKNDAVEFAKYLSNNLKELIANAKTEEEKFGIAFMMATMPSNYAESKGFHPYKSLPIIAKAMDKYAKDATIKKIMKESGIDDLK